ncbi:hypothetical protein [Rhodococcus sp. WAY2]|nr:hypothetical protein [Rhodococcus sp. WAY2]QHE73837.1 hypothetical protein GFS60_07506 [Rhodococcus sp. WAY2]
MHLRTRPVTATFAATLTAAALTLTGCSAAAYRERYGVLPSETLRTV